MSETLRFTVEVPAEDAKVFFRHLNDDDGIRENTVRMLLDQRSGRGIEQWTRIVNVFGGISRGISLALESAGLLNTPERKAEIKLLAEASATTPFVPTVRRSRSAQTEKTVPSASIWSSVSKKGRRGNERA